MTHSSDPMNANAGPIAAPGKSQESFLEARISEEDAAAWAALLLSQTTETEHCLGAMGGSEGGTVELSETSQGSSDSGEKHGEGRHQSAASMTPKVSAGHESQMADTLGVNDTSPKRLILNVDSETLGRVQLIVDREEGGVRLTVGSDPESRARLSAGKHTLSEALASAGVRVNALRIVASHEVGTVLAQDLSSQRSDDSASEEFTAHKNGSQSPTATQKRSNLNLIG